MNEINEMFETLRRNNRNLIASNVQLLQVVYKLENEARDRWSDSIERERYVQYLEQIIFENDWKPRKD